MLNKHKNPIKNLKSIHKKPIIIDTIHPSLLSYIKHNCNDGAAKAACCREDDTLYLNYNLSKLKLFK